MRVFSVLVIVFILIELALSDLKSLKPDITITQKVEGNGLHRMIKWLIEMSSPDQKTWTDSECNMTLQLVFTSGMYVNPDQISDLNRMGELSTFIDGDVDIEKAAHEATEHTIYVYLPNTNVHNILVNLPFHLRYQRSQIGGGYGKVLLRKPSLLLYCKQSLKMIRGKGLKVEAPCTVDRQKFCIWKNFSYNSMIDDVELYVPVGDLDDYPMVAIVTLLLGCAGCIYVLSVLSTKPL